MDDEETTHRVLDAAERLFYEQGVQAVGMDAVRTASGVSLKRLYLCFASKQELVVATLRRRDERWRYSLAGSVAERAREPRERVLAVFDWLHDWFGEPGFRGCAFLNSAAEVGPAWPAVTEVARQHRESLHRYLAELAAGIPVNEPRRVATRLQLLLDGAIASAAINGDPTAASHAREAAETFLG